VADVLFCHSTDSVIVLSEINNNGSNHWPRPFSNTIKFLRNGLLFYLSRPSSTSAPHNHTVAAEWTINQQ